MKIHRKYVVSSLLATAIVGFGIAAFIFIKSNVHAATTPSLGAAATYGVLSTTYTNTAAGTTINGDVGFTVGPAVEPDPVGGHTHYGSGAPYTTAGTDQSSALSALNSQACTVTFGAAVDLFLDTSHGTAGVYTPGVYCSIGAMSASGSITLSGNGTYIFRAVGALNTTAGIAVNLAAGASACDVFWTPSGDTTLGANTAFKGTVIQNGDITIGANTVWSGRALAFSGAITSGATSSITVPTCTPPPATLHIVKQVVNNSGGGAVASSFNLHVKSSGADVAGSPAAGTTTPGTPYSLAAGIYAVSEDANSAYTQSFSGDCDSGGNITLASGEDKTCTITNDDIPPTLHVIKHVVNSSGGTATASSFNLHVKLSGADIVGSPAAGVEAPGNSYSPNAGTYIVSEDANAGYTQSFSGACNSSGGVTLSVGDDKTCTITNNDIPATLHVIKKVINDNGGTAVAATFNLHVKRSGVDVTGSPAAGTDTPGTAYSVATGTYTISEDANTSYSQTFTGDCDAGGNVALTLGSDKTCTVINNDVPATITVVKVVINDNGHTKSVADFPLFVNGTPVASGAVTTFLAPGTYAITETTDPQYAQTFSGDCNVSGTMSLSLGDAKVCTITNDDIGAPIVTPPVPPFITVVKTPSSLTLPSGPGAVTYTYTLHNIGTVTATNVTLADDSCSPLVYASGDTNADTQLEVGETWTYTCTSTLTATHANHVVASVLANGITATDIASATVVVGSSTVPPLIHIIKIPIPSTLFSGQSVTYTEQITNPGMAPLNNVTLTDDTCAPLTYNSGDTNHDAKLDTTEVWTYTCTTIPAKSITNTATASGEANGLTARDFAFATVIVATAFPKPPNTGFSGVHEGTQSLLFPAGVTVILIMCWLAQRKWPHHKL